MALLKKEFSNGKKYLRFGPVRIPYETDRTAEIRKVVVGPFSMSYRYEEDTGMIYLRLIRWEVPFGAANPSRRLEHYTLRGKLDDETCKKILCEELPPLLGYEPDLDQPRTFNEKINWLKLHDRNPLIPICCDKYAVKKYAAEIVGEEHILPVLGVWEKGKDIDFETLPDQFVLKVNWSSGFNIIVKDKSKLDIPAVRRQVDQWMGPCRNSYYDTFNWGYRDMKPVAFAEPYIEQANGQVYDYKFYYCRSEFLYMFIATERHTDQNLTYTFFDDQFRVMPFTYGNKPNETPVPAMPHNLDKMVELGKKLAEPFTFVRVDFYETDAETFYLGEMTFYSGGGTLPFDPPEWDEKLGEKIRLTE